MLNLLEDFFTVLMLLYLSSGLTGFLAGDSASNVWRLKDNPLLLSIEAAMYTITFGFVALHWRRFISSLRYGIWVQVLALLAVISSVWSSDPEFTLRRGLVVIATTVFGIHFGARFSATRQLRLLSCSLLILAALSIGCALLLPQYGIDSGLHRGDWQGVLGQKNLLGRAMGLGVIALWCAKSVLPPLLRVPGLALCALPLVMSGSLTSLIATAMLLLMPPLHRLLRARVTTAAPLLIALLVAFGAAGFFAYVNSSALLAALGKDATLTKRTEIWSAVWAAISSRVLLGYGFGGFWTGIQGHSGRLLADLGFVARHAHNGFLDLWLELGIVGLTVFAAGYFYAERNAIRLLRKNRGRLATWPLQYLCFMLLCNLAEGPILRQNSLYWALYVAVVVCSATALRIQRSSRLTTVGQLQARAVEQHNHLSRQPAGSVRKFHSAAGGSVA